MQYYVGFTRNLQQRLRAHREGDGCVTTHRAFDQGIGFMLARVWWPPARCGWSDRARPRGPVNYCPFMSPAPAHR